MILTPGRRLIVPAVEAIGPLTAVLALVLLAAILVDDTVAPNAATTGLMGWFAACCVSLALWAGGLVLRRSDDGLRSLVSFAVGLSIAGATLIFVRPAEPFPLEAVWPKTALATLGLQAMVASGGPLVAAFGIDYRRTDPWYVVAFGTALVPWAVVGGSWLLAIRDATGL